MYLLIVSTFVKDTGLAFLNSVPYSTYPSIPFAVQGYLFIICIGLVISILLGNSTLVGSWPVEAISLASFTQGSIRFKEFLVDCID